MNEKEKEKTEQRINMLTQGPRSKPPHQPLYPAFRLTCLPPCSFGLISRISSHPAVFFSHNKPANSAFSTINQRNEHAVQLYPRLQDSHPLWCSPHRTTMRCNRTALVPSPVLAVLW
jgi:hypothetical protein